MIFPHSSGTLRLLCILILLSIAGQARAENSNIDAKALTALGDSYCSAVVDFSFKILEPLFHPAVLEWSKEKRALQFGSWEKYVQLLTRQFLVDEAVEKCETVMAGNVACTDTPTDIIIDVLPAKGVVINNCAVIKQEHTVDGKQKQIYLNAVMTAGQWKWVGFVTDADSLKMIEKKLLPVTGQDVIESSPKAMEILDTGKRFCQYILEYDADSLINMIHPAHLEAIKMKVQKEQDTKWSEVVDYLGAMLKEQATSQCDVYKAVESVCSECALKTHEKLGLKAEKCGFFKSRTTKRNGDESSETIWTALVDGKWRIIDDLDYFETVQPIDCQDEDRAEINECYDFNSCKRKADAAVQWRDNETAIKYIDKALAFSVVDKYPKENERLSSAHALRGLAHFRSDNNDMAMKDLNHALELYPDSPNVLFNRALVFEETGKQSSASIDYTRAIELNPNFYSAYCNRGSIRLDQEDYDGAAQDYTRLIEIQPDNEESYQKRGAVYYESDQYTKAIEDFTSAIKLNPEELDNYLGRGASYTENGDYELAMADISHIFEKDTDNPLYYAARARLFQRINEKDRAIADYSRALQLDPQREISGLYLPVVYSYLGMFDEAIDEINKEIKGAPNDSTLYLDRGNIHLERGDFRRAIDDFTRAIELDSEYSDAFFNRAIAYSNSCNYELSLEDYNKTILKTPEDADAWTSRGLVFFSMGQYEKALEDYTAALKVNPKNPDKILEMAEYYIGMKNKEKAIEYIVPGIESLKQDTDWSPTALEAIKQHYNSLKLNKEFPSPDELLSNASKAEQSNDIVKATVYYTAFLMMNPRNSEINFKLATCFKQLKEHNYAATYFHRYLYLNPDAPNKQEVLRMIEETIH